MNEDSVSIRPRQAIRRSPLTLALGILFACVACSEGAESPAIGTTTQASASADGGADGGAPGFCGGAGSLVDPYLICTCPQLQQMEADVDAHYRLASDIDCTSFDAGDGNGFRPVGDSDWEGRFRGSLDGDGYIISNLSISRSAENNVALFGATRDATVQQVGLSSATVAGGEKTAGLIGFMDGGQVSECFVTGAVTGGWSAGGLVAYAFYGAIADSYSAASVDGGLDSGLAIGIIDNSTVDRVYTSGAAASSGLTFLGYELTSTTSGAFFDCTVAGSCTASRAAPTSDLQNQSYLEASSYDFVGVWGYRGAGTYACLQWEAGCGGTCGTTDGSCDGVDDDCDGNIDEDYASYATTCGDGVCASTGATSCVAGLVQDSCSAGSPSGPDDSCDSVDQDCDGATDEAYAASATSCGVGSCADTGATSCVDGVVEDTCSPGTPAADDATCDDADDDCDGATDEDYAGSSTSCGVGACAATGVMSCSAGVESDSCAPGSPMGDDSTCDGVDDDCDGVVDEGYTSVPTNCGTGVCATTGATSCVAGAVVDSCETGTPSGDDSTCDGSDDDCDGSIDEAYATVATSCGDGVCGAVGATACVAGMVEDSCVAGSPVGPDTVCDGLDSDCDGSTDEAYSPTATSCGTGACSANGTTACVAGAETDSCAPGSPTGDDSTCDGVDSDCDGTTDEAYASEATSCGDGVCGATGATACVAGAVQDSCAPGSPTGPDTVCDGLDSDCDGSTDEAYSPTPTTCGVGVCSASGTTACSAGIETDSCVAGSPTGADQLCDGLDEDCDGSVDEGYSSVATSCGVGVCSASGATSCVGGAVVDGCSPGTATGDDSSCDGVDADCDGAVDESFAPSATACGLGVCAAAGVTSCVSGTVVDSCSPGTPTGDDSTCDARDADCDGAVDEAFVSTPTGCGVGGCARTGTLICADGSVQDTCVAGSPSAADTTCDGFDDDCDAVSDEDFVAYCSASATVECAGGTEVVTECDDSDACNGGETCSGGVCQAGSAPSLDDGNPCTADSCDPIAGVMHDPLPQGTDCGDGDVCNGAETCDDGGVCVGGPPPTVDDGYPCTIDSCDPITGVQNDYAPAGTSCSDGDPCNGDEVCNAGGVCTSGLPPAMGACVPPAPTAAFFVPKQMNVLSEGAGATLVATTNVNGVPSDPYGEGLTFTTMPGSPPGDFTVALTGQRPGVPQILERVRMRATTASYTVRNFEIWASSTTADPSEFELVFAGTLPQEERFVEYELPMTAARFVRFAIVDNYGDTFSRAYDLSIFSSSNVGSLVSMDDAGAVATATSGSVWAGRLNDYCDASCGTGWFSDTGDVGGTDLTIDLAGDQVHLIDAVRLVSDGSTSALRDFEIWVSQTGQDPADFSLVTAAEMLREDDQRFWYGFDPVPARFVRLRVVSNYGATRVRILDVGIHSAERGGLEVQFQDLSSPGGDPIEHWLWEFR